MTSQVASLLNGDWSDVTVIFARGEKPKAPDRVIKDTQVLGPDNDFHSIGTLFAEIPASTFRVTVHREQVGEEEYEDGDWTYDYESGE